MKKLFWVFIFTLFTGLITNESASAQRHGYNHQRQVRHAAYNRGYHDGARAAYRHDRRHYPRYYAHRGYYAPRPYHHPRYRRHYYAPAPRPRAVVRVRVPLPPPPPVVVVRP